MENGLVICDTGVLSRNFLSTPSFVEVVNDRIGLSNVRITPVILIEFLNWVSGFRQLSKSERVSALLFIKSQRILHFSDSISELAVELAHKNINSKPGDTLIAATSLHYSLPVYTINKTDFRQLGVQLFE